MAKKNPFSFSGNHLEFDEISVYYADSKSALKQYFSLWHENKDRFKGYQLCEVETELRSRINELDLLSTFSLLSSLEAAFRIDYIARCEKNKKDSLSRAFQKNYNKNQSRVSLEEVIFNAWREHTMGIAQIIGELKGAFKYRHWLAHGRYWMPKPGRANYDFGSVYVIAETVFNSFPFEKTS